MRKLQLLTAMAIGISASSIGAIQVEAALYTFNVDFSTKEVANFDDYTQSFFTTTYDLNAKITYRFSGTYYFNSCPGGFNGLNVDYISYARVNGTGTVYSSSTLTLPDFLCTTSPTTYTASSTIDLAPELVNAIMNDDANFARFWMEIYFRQSALLSGRILNLVNFIYEYILEYDFNTTYLFNYFLSDTKYNNDFRSAAGGGSWNKRSEDITTVDYVYTTAGNDEYRIVNTDFLANLGTLRKKYAVDYNMEYFRGESVGAKISRKHNTNSPFDTDQLTLGSSGISTYTAVYDYYYLNTANNAQAIVDAPEFNFTYEDCGWDVFNIPCFINNGLAYITNDAPIISDAITLLNAGIAMAAQTFGIIGAFTTDNVFGYLILAGFGFIAVRWFLKND